MITDYLDRFPIPSTHLPDRLHGLLAPVSDDPQIQVEVAIRMTSTRRSRSRIRAYGHGFDAGAQA